MARKAFFSFHYSPDCWRASQVRNMGMVEGNAPVSDNDWESIKRGGDDAIKKWIANQIGGKSCTVVLVGENTYQRKWVLYEISKSWNEKKGVLGIRIHGLKNSSGNQGISGPNPFSSITLNGNSKKLDSVVKLYDPPFTSSTYVYDHIKENLSDWVQKAIQIRDSHD
jgi:MTH538 TIR-like domain (DUF1863)